MKSIGKTRPTNLHANRNRASQNAVWMIGSRAPNFSVGEGSGSLPAWTSSHVLRTLFQEWVDNLTESEHGGADDLVEFPAVGP
jgi:hypothetical protein